MKLIIVIFSLLFVLPGNPNLNQDIVYPAAATVKIGNGETCEVISEKDMFAARDILHAYWKSNLADSTWGAYNRQYLLYHSLKMGTVAYINGACLEKPADFYQRTWCLGMALAPCYFTAFVDLSGKRVISFKFNTYDKK